MSTVRGHPREGSGARFALGLVGLIALMSLALAPFFSPVEVTKRPGRVSDVPADIRSVNDQIRGSMTLQDVEKVTGVPS